MKGELNNVKKIIVKTFADFGISMDVLKAYEGINHIHLHLVPKKPVRMHEISSFVNDLRFALGRYVVKIEAPVKNKKEIKISVLKDNRGAVVTWSSLDYLQQQNVSPLTIPLGMTEENKTMLVDIATLPHLLVGGRMITGKTNFVHGLINSLISRNGPDVLRLILVDPKQEGMPLYKGLPHLLTPPIDSSEKTILALKWACKEMERRYDVLEATDSENIADYHQKVSVADKRKEPLPYIVIVIDELAEVMADYGDEAEKLMRRLAMMARGAGIHMILTTASSEPRILRGTLRANIFSALSFGADSEAASEAFIYQSGAEELIGQGVGLFTSSDFFTAIEVRTGLIDEKEIKENVLKVKRRHGVVDDKNIDLKTLADYNLTIFAFDEEDDLYEDAKKAVMEAGKASTSYIQRKLRIGYSRAARLIDLLEERGVVGPADGTSPREILED